MTTAILLLAAGASRRFGPDDKLLAPLAGKPLVRHAADAARAVKADLYLAVVSTDAVSDALPDFRKIVVDPGLPQSESLKTGVTVAKALNATRVVVVLGDMPRVTPALIERVMARGQNQPAAATDGQKIMPPACLPASVFGAVAELTGDRGAAAILAHLPPAQRVLAEAALLADVDVADDLARLDTE